MDPGNAIYKTRNTPKVIGGATAECLECAVTLYSHIIEKVVPVSSTETAEMVKLLENTFRAVNIGLVNEVAIMSRRLGIDAFEVIRAAATKPLARRQTRAPDVHTARNSCPMALPPSPQGSGPEDQEHRLPSPSTLASRAS